MRTRKPLDLDKVTVAILLLISLHVEKPCPTRNQIVKQTGLPKRKVWLFMDELHRRGLVWIDGDNGHALVPIVFVEFSDARLVQL